MPLALLRRLFLESSASLLPKSEFCLESFGTKSKKFPEQIPGGQNLYPILLDSQSTNTIIVCRQYVIEVRKFRAYLSSTYLHIVNNLQYIHQKYLAGSYFEFTVDLLPFYTSSYYQKRSDFLFDSYSSFICKSKEIYHYLHLGRPQYYIYVSTKSPSTSRILSEMFKSVEN